eukprot:3601614-Pleurochrysis_carterae.AAC.1
MKQVSVDSCASSTVYGCAVVRPSGKCSKSDLGAALRVSGGREPCRGNSRSLAPCLAPSVLSRFRDWRRA